MDLIIGLIIALVGIGFMFFMLTPSNMPDNLIGYFFRILGFGVGIVALGFLILALF